LSGYPLNSVGYFESNIKSRFFIQKDEAVKANRRTAIKTGGALASLVALGIVTAQQAHAAGRPGFEARTLQDALRAVGGVPAPSNQIRVTSPDIAENGALVPVGVSSILPGVTELFILVEHNPFPLLAAFTLAPGTEPDVQIRIRMGQSSNIVAVVRSNGQLFSATKSTRVTLGGCGA